MSFIENTLNYCKDIENLTGVCCAVIDRENGEFRKEPFCLVCPDAGKRCDFKVIHYEGAVESARLGGKYRYRCPAGCSFLALSVESGRERDALGLIAGPFRYASGDEDDYRSAGGWMKNIPVFTPERADSFERCLFAICGFLGIQRNPQEESERLQREALESLGKIPEMEDYPIEKENELQQMIRVGNRNEAGRLVNEILLRIYAGNGMNLSRLKLRVRDLLTLISRAAVEGGADITEIFSLLDRFSVEIENAEDFDTLDSGTGSILHLMFDRIFSGRKLSGQPLIRKANLYIQEHLTEHLTLKKIADAVGRSENYFCRILKEETGQTVTEYINRLRIERSKTYLIYSTMSVAEAAAACGFESQSYFTRIFRRYTGVTPGQFRKEHGNAGADVR